MINLPKATKKRINEQNEAPITPTKIGMVLEKFCTMEKLTLHPTMLPFFYAMSSNYWRKIESIQSSSQSQQPFRAYGN
jgi:hypothetical protein